MSDVGLTPFIAAARDGRDGDAALVAARVDAGRDFAEVWHRAHDEHRELLDAHCAGAGQHPEDADAVLDEAIDAVFARVGVAAADRLVAARSDHQPPDRGAGRRGAAQDESPHPSAPVSTIARARRRIAVVVGVAAALAAGVTLTPSFGASLGVRSPGAEDLLASLYGAALSSDERAAPTILAAAHRWSAAPEASDQRVDELPDAGGVAAAPPVVGSASAASGVDPAAGGHAPTEEAIPPAGVAGRPPPLHSSVPGALHVERGLERGLERWSAPRVAGESAADHGQAGLRSDTQTSRRRRPSREDAAADSDPIATLEEQARLAWQEGRLQDADNALRAVIAEAGSRRRVELAWGDRFTLARRIGGRDAEVRLWRAYLAARPHGWHAEDARAGLCRAESDDEHQRECWCDYLAAFPDGAHVDRARSRCE